MQKKLPLSSRPPIKSSVNLEDQRLKEFIEEAESPKRSGSFSINSEKKGMSFVPPWENKNVRTDVQKTFNLRLPEPYYIKLKFLSGNMKESHHKILMDIICPEIDRKIKEIIEKMI